MGAELITYRNGSKKGSSLNPKNALAARNSHASSSKLVIYQNGVRNSPPLNSKKTRSSPAGSPKAAISSSNKATSLGVVRDKAFSKPTVNIEPNENRGEETVSVRIATEDAKRSSAIKNFTPVENRLACCVAEGGEESLRSPSDNANVCTNHSLVLDVVQEKATMETTDDEKYHPEDSCLALDVVKGIKENKEKITKETTHNEKFDPEDSRLAFNTVESTKEVKETATKETTSREMSQLDDERLALDVVEGTKEGLRIAFDDAKMEFKKLISEGNHWLLGIFGK